MRCLVGQHLRGRKPQELLLAEVHNCGRFTPVQDVPIQHHLLERPGFELKSKAGCSKNIDNIVSSGYNLYTRNENVRYPVWYHAIHAGLGFFLLG